MASSIDQNQLNRTIEGALEDLWVKLIEHNQYATGEELFNTIFWSHQDVADLFADWVDSRGFIWKVPVGDWK